jgi:hypothetical protein
MGIIGFHSEPAGWRHNSHHSEADGYSAEDARTLGAIINIMDGKGTIYDQAKFFRNTAATHGADEALAAGRRIGAEGRKASAIGLSASDNTWDAFINERISEDHAAEISLAAPGNDDLQRVGLKAALKGKSPQDAANLVRVASLSTVAKTTKGKAIDDDWFGNDAAIKAMAEQAERASQIQAQYTESIRTILGASRKPEVAARFGINVKDPAALEAKLAELRAERARWESWHLNPDLVKIVQGKAPMPDFTKGTTPTEENVQGEPRRRVSVLADERVWDETADTVARRTPEELTQLHQETQQRMARAVERRAMLKERIETLSKQLGEAVKQFPAEFKALNKNRRISGEELAQAEADFPEVKRWLNLQDDIKATIKMIGNASVEIGEGERLIDLILDQQDRNAERGISPRPPPPKPPPAEGGGEVTLGEPTGLDAITEPLGLRRKWYPDSSLRGRSWEDLRKQIKELTPEIDKLERKVDDNSLTQSEAVQLGKLQDRWSQLHFERDWLSWNDTHSGDLFPKLLDAVDRNPKPGSDAHNEALAIIEILMGRNHPIDSMIQAAYGMLPERILRDPDFQEVAQSRLKKLKEFLVENRDLLPKRKGTPPEPPKALPPPSGEGGGVELTFGEPAAQAAPGPQGLPPGTTPVAGAGRMPVALNNVAPPGAGRISIPEVFNHYKRVMRAVGSPTPIRWGRMGQAGRNMRGFFKPDAEVIRINTADNIATAAHEIAHAVDLRMFRKPGNPLHTSTPPDVRAELVNLGTLVRQPQTRAATPPKDFRTDAALAHAGLRPDRRAQPPLARE